jgi:hypothetical protein
VQVAFAGEDHRPTVGDRGGGEPEEVFGVVRVGAAADHQGGCPYPVEAGFGVEGGRGSVGDQQVGGLPKTRGFASQASAPAG